MIASMQITDAGIFTFIVILAFKLLRRKVLFINKKTIQIIKSRLLLKKTANFAGKLLQN